MSYLARVYYTTDGVTASFAVPFEYMVSSYVHVYKDNVEITTGFSWSSGSQITFSPIIATGHRIEFRRQTPSDAALSTIQSGSVSHVDLNQNFLQSIYIMEEILDAANESAGRAMRMPDGEAGVGAMPSVANRKGKYAAFNSDTGAPEVSTKTVEAVEDTLDDHSTRLTNDENRITSLETEVGDHADELAVLDEAKTDHETRIGTLETASSNHADRLGTLEGYDAGFRLDTLEGSVRQLVLEVTPEDVVSPPITDAEWVFDGLKTLIPVNATTGAKSIVFSESVLTASDEVRRGKVLKTDATNNPVVVVWRHTVAGVLTNTTIDVITTPRVNGGPVASRTVYLSEADCYVTQEVG